MEWYKFYVFVLGISYIGCSDGLRSPDIAIKGTGIEKEHCYIDNNNGVVTLYPLADLISLDNIRITTPTRLTQGR